MKYKFNKEKEEEVLLI